MPDPSAPVGDARPQPGQRYGLHAFLDEDGAPLDLYRDPYDGVLVAVCGRQVRVPSGPPMRDLRDALTAEIDRDQRAETGMVVDRDGDTWIKDAPGSDQWYCVSRPGPCRLDLRGIEHEYGPVVRFVPAQTGR